MFRAHSLMGNRLVDVDEFADRLAGVRQRFTAALAGKIDDGFAALPTLTKDDDASIEALVATHRRLHEMCGIAPSLGLEDIGSAARAAETVLREPAKAKRPLKSEEVEALRITLQGLRAASQNSG
jgi:chemotaxis protein histidine kinase CheA